jgi:hypothetical protein
MNCKKRFSPQCLLSAQELLLASKYISTPFLKTYHTNVKKTRQFLVSSSVLGARAQLLQAPGHPQTIPNINTRFPSSSELSGASPGLGKDEMRASQSAASKIACWQICQFISHKHVWGSYGRRSRPTSCGIFSMLSEFANDLRYCGIDSKLPRFFTISIRCFPSRSARARSPVTASLRICCCMSWSINTRGSLLMIGCEVGFIISAS